MKIGLSKDIMAIQGLFDDRANCYSLVHMKHGQVRYPESPNKFIGRLLEKVDGSLPAATQCSRMLLNRYTKVPIVLDEARALIILPIYPMERKDNTWLVFHHIKSVVETSKTDVVITLTNNTELAVQVDKANIDRQLEKAEKLLEVIRGE